MDVVGRCAAPGCDRSARAAVQVLGAGQDASGLVCPRHAAHTALGAALWGAGCAPVRRLASPAPP